MRRIPLLLALLTSALPGTPPDRLGEALAALHSPEAARRGAGERWLAGHIGPADLPRLTEAALGAGAEVRLRIARAVGEGDGRLALTSAFLTDERTEIRELGESALRMRVARWNPDVSGHGLTGSDLRYELLDAARRAMPETIRLTLRETLGDTCALLARRAALPIGLAVDPSVASRRARFGGDSADPVRLVGTWDEVVLAVASYYRVGLEGFGLRTAQDGPEPYAFVRFCSPVEEGLRDLGEIVAGWCRTLALGRGGERRAAAARALAGCGWPEGVEWLVDRAFVRPSAGEPELADGAALEGVLAAASQGRVAPALGRAEIVALLVGLAEDPGGDPEKRARSMAIVDALGRFADRTTGTEPVETGGVVLRGWEQADEFGRWVRLAILEGIGSPSASAPALEVLGDEGAGVDLELQALRTLRAATAGLSDPGEVRPTRLAELLDGPGNIAEAVELGALFASTGVRGGEGGGVGFLGGVALLVRDLFVGHTDGAADLWRRLAPLEADRPGGLARALALAQDAGASVTSIEEAWRRARATAEVAERQRVDRIALLAGVVPGAEVAEIALPLLEERDGPDLALLGALAGRGAGKTPEAARARLTELFTQALERGDSPERAAPLLEALERAIGDLRAREFLPSPGGRAERQGEERGASPAALWRRDLRSRIVAHGVSGFGRERRGLAARLGPTWPPPRPPRIVDLDRFDRRPGRW